jgi:hypothetical protein
LVRGRCHGTQLSEKGLAVSWEFAERIATRELDVEGARRLYLEQLVRDSGPLELLTLISIAIIFETSARRAQGIATDPDFPPWVALVGGNKCWYREDVEAARAGLEVSGRREGEAQHLVYGAQDVVDFLGISQRLLASHVNRRAWHAAPEPAGKAGSYWYWMRADVKRWKKNRDRRTSRA